MSRLKGICVICLISWMIFLLYYTTQCMPDTLKKLYMKDVVSKYISTFNHANNNSTNDRKPQFKQQSNSIKSMLQRRKTRLKSYFSDTYTSDEYYLNNSNLILLVSFWRSGSTWVGELLSLSDTNSFYVYEPLHILEYEFNKTKSILYHGYRRHLTEQLFQCDISPEFMKHTLKWSVMYRPKRCIYLTCRTHKHITKSCIRAPYRIVKTVRLSLNEVEEMMMKPSLKNLKVIYLVRDPRGVMYSLSKADGIKATVDQVCPRMRSDMHFYNELVRAFPNRVLFLRYEDLALDPIQKATELWTFIHGKPTKPTLPLSWIYFLGNSSLPKGTQTSQIGSFDITKKSTQDFQLWRSNISNIFIKNGESRCNDVINALGYQKFSSLEGVRNLSFPLLSQRNCTKIPCFYEEKL